jgi:hypothetical protein
MTVDEIYEKLDPLVEFKPWVKIPRLNRDMVITEKIDGTNAAIGIIKLGPAAKGHPDLDSPAVKLGAYSDGTEYAVYAQSRRRVISPWDDNYGFAAWVHEHAETLAEDLGPGLHYGEWWGQGIQRDYGQRRKIFSLFNVQKWEVSSALFQTPDVRTVPVLTRWTFDTNVIRDTLRNLEENGSHAAPGYMNPEGIVVYHPASQSLFKATIDNDSQPKSLSQQRRLAVVNGMDLAA